MPVRWPRLASSTTSERTSATSALSGASSPQPMTGAVLDRDDEAVGVRLDVLERPRQQMARAEVRGDERVNGGRVVRDARAQLDVHERGRLHDRRDRRFEQRQRFVDLAFGNHVRRQQPDDRVGRAVDEQMPLERRLDDGGRRAIELEAPHHARRRARP